MRKLKIEQKKKEIEVKRKKLEEMKLMDEQNRKNLIIDPSTLPSLAVPPLVKTEKTAAPGIYYRHCVSNVGSECSAKSY